MGEEPFCLPPLVRVPAIRRRVGLGQYASLDCPQCLQSPGHYPHSACCLRVSDLAMGRQGDILFPGRGGGSKETNCLFFLVMEGNLGGLIVSQRWWRKGNHTVSWQRWVIQGNNNVSCSGEAGRATIQFHGRIEISQMEILFPCLWEGGKESN